MQSAGQPVKLPEWTEKQSMLNKNLYSAMNQYKKHGTVMPGTERMLQIISDIPKKRCGGYITKPDNVRQNKSLLNFINPSTSKPK